MRPFYLPGNRVVYAQKFNGRFVIEAAAFDGGAALQLTYAPGNALPTDVLRDGVETPTRPLHAGPVNPVTNNQHQPRVPSPQPPARITTCSTSSSSTPDSLTWGIIPNTRQRLPLNNAGPACSKRN